MVDESFCSITIKGGNQFLLRKHIPSLIVEIIGELLIVGFFNPNTLLASFADVRSAMVAQFTKQVLLRQGQIRLNAIIHHAGKSEPYSILRTGIMVRNF